MKFPQTALGTSQQPNSGIRAREPRAVLGPSPDRAGQRASVRACCHRVEAWPRSRELWGTPRPPRPPKTLSRPGSLRPQATGLTAPRWPWQSGRPGCCTPEAPSGSQGREGVGRVTGKPARRAFRRRLAGGGGAPGLEGEHRPALLCPSGPAAWGVLSHPGRCRPRRALGHPSPRPLPAAPSLEGREERRGHSCAPVPRPGPPPPPYAHGRPWPLKKHFVKTVVAGPARVCRT